MAGFLDILGLPLLACVTTVGILAPLGLHVLQREIIFIDIAVAQVVAVAVIAAHTLLGTHADSWLAQGCGLGAALLIAALYALVRRRVPQIPLEAVIGVTYAIAAAGALFLVGVAPGGHVHVQHMLAGSILWVTWRDLLVAVPVFALVGLGCALLHRPLERISRDYRAAGRAGLRVVWWDFLFYGLIGLVITFAVQIAGVVLVFAFLIIPATISALVATSWRVRLLVAWAAGLLGSGLGLGFAARLDFSVGPAVALLLGALLVAVALGRVTPRRLAVAGGAGLLLGYVVLLATAASSDPGSPPPLEPAAHQPELRPAVPEPATPPPTPLSQLTTMAELEARFAASSRPDQQCEVVEQALALEPAAAAGLALRFLEGDPPLFYRQAVVTELDRHLGPTGLDPTRAWSAPVNREAATALRSRLAAPHPPGPGDGGEPGSR
jgi:zinc/manganese transport system permease protein